MNQAELNKNLLYAAAAGDMDKVKKLLGEGAEINAPDQGTGNTPLHMSVQQGHTELVRFLVESSADLSLKTSDEGRTPLHNVGYGGLVKKGDPQVELDICEILLKAGAEVDAINFYKVTPLVYCITYEKPWLVRRLLDAGADTNASWQGLNKSLFDYTASLHWRDKQAQNDILAILEKNYNNENS